MNELVPWRYWRDRKPDQAALYLDNEILTWRQVCQKVDEYAACLLAHPQLKAQPEQQKVVLLVGKNHPELLFWLLASMQTGVLCALTLPQPERTLRIKLAQLYADPQNAVIYYASDDELSLSFSYSALSFKPFKTPKVASQVACYHPQQLASLIFTSGSTGTPKAVAHTHEQHLASAQGLLQHLAFGEHDIWLLSLPLYHVSGLAIVYRWLAAGAGLKLGGGHLITDIIQVTHASLVPTQLMALLDAFPDQLNLTTVLLGGAAIPPILAEKARQRGIQTWVGYGLTEAASTVTAQCFDGTTAVGTPLTGRQLKIEQQRIWISGDTLASGYYQQGRLYPLTQNIDSSGMAWFDTQDLGVWQQGRLVIKGRADNCFISGGENVHCEEVEAVLMAHPWVNHAIVVPVYDERFGARPLAVIDSQPRLDDASADVWCQTHLEKFKCPVAYFTLPEFLMGTGIKISRVAVKLWLSQHQPQFQVMS